MVKLRNTRYEKGGGSKQFINRVTYFTNDPQVDRHISGKEVRILKLFGSLIEDYSFLERKQIF